MREGDAARKLGDNAGKPKYIITAPQLGYRTANPHKHPARHSSIGHYHLAIDGAAAPARRP